MHQTVEGRGLASWGFFGAACLMSSLTTLPAAAQGKAPGAGSPSALPAPPPPSAAHATTAPPLDPSAQAVPPPPPPPGGQGYPLNGQQAHPPYPYPPYGQQPYSPYPPSGAYPGWQSESPGAAPKGGDILPYNEGYEIPPGYHKEERRRSGLIIGGSIMLGVAWGISATIGTSLWTDSGRAPLGALVVPAAGPFIMMAGLDYDSAGAAFALPLLLVDGLAQAGGLAMLIVGLQSRTVLARDGIALVQPMRALKPEFSVGPGSVGMRMHF